MRGQGTVRVMLLATFDPPHPALRATFADAAASATGSAASAHPEGKALGAVFERLPPGVRRFRAAGGR